MNFSSILDISSFFIGMIINLLLVALVSYYFKRKYDHLEKSINEHSDHLYLLLKKERDTIRNIENRTIVLSDMPSINDTMIFSKKNYPSVASTQDSSSDSESESDDETNDTQSETDEIHDLDEIHPSESSEEFSNIVVEELNIGEVNDTKQLTIQEIKSEEQVVLNVQKIDFIPSDYNKLTMKQLKDLLSNKGIPVKPSMKKNDLIDLASKNSLEIDTELNKNPSHMSIADCDLDLTNLNDATTLISDIN